MVPLSMTLSDFWSGFQGHDIFWSRISKKDKVTIAEEKTIPNIWNGAMFGDLDWRLNASRGCISISWASCWLLLTYLLSVVISRRTSTYKNVKTKTKMPSKRKLKWK